MKRKLVLPLVVLAAALAACGLAACNDTGDTPGGNTPGGNVPGGNAGNEYLVFETLADGSLQVSADSSKEMPEEIVIPSEYEGKPVTAVKAQGFALNRAEGLERIVIPEGVTSIGEAVPPFKTSNSGAGSPSFPWAHSAAARSLPSPCPRR